MCTRFYIDESLSEQPYVQEVEKSALYERMLIENANVLKKSGEIRPTDTVVAFAPSRTGERTPFPMVWGYTVEGIMHPLVNARVESAKYRKTFSEDWYKHRCVIPASWYFEWQHYQGSDGKIKTGDKFAIQPRDTEMIWLAGLYRIEERNNVKYPVFTILTGEPTEDLRKIHDRMPVLLPEQSVDEWISPKSDPERVAKTALTDMVYETAD